MIAQGSRWLNYSSLPRGDPYHKALAKEEEGDRRCAANSDPRQALKEGHSAQRVAAKEHLQANDDLTLEEHSEAFEEEFGQRVSTSTVGRAISELPDGGWPLKKSHRDSL
jgi:transposase